MKFKFIIYILLGIAFFYFAHPVPYCKLQDKSTFDTSAVYTPEQKQEIKQIEVMVLNVQGISMYPTILNNSRCLCVKQENYFIGDIVFYFANLNGQLNGISHRIIKISGMDYYPKGDNNDFIDPPMTKENIVCAIPTVPRIFAFF